jgi:hypothetical protein
MGYPTNPRTFADLPVVNYNQDSVGQPTGVEDPAKVAWRLGVEYDDGPAEFAQLFEHFLADVGGEHVTALLVGQWGGAAYEHKAPVALLAGKAAALPNLRALFLGDMESEECEISWIQHDDITPLVEAYPALEILTVRGGEGLSVSPLRLASLHTLVFESGGLPAGVVRAVAQSDLPAVRHLELWLGTGEYGGDSTVEDLADILAGARLPAITRLGLCDSEIADDVAAAVASAPVVARLEVLDLSMGTLTDRGAQALLAGQPLTHLRELDLEYHFMSTEMMERLRAELAGVRVNVDDRQNEGEFGRFVAVSE